MERSVDRYAWHCEYCTGISDVAAVFGTRVANTILASELASRQKAGHMIACDRVGKLLKT